MLHKTETEHYLEEALKVLGDALEVIQFSAHSSCKSEKVAELAELLREVPGIVRSAGHPSLLSDTGIGKLQHKIEYGKRIMRDIERIGVDHKPRLLDRLRTLSKSSLKLDGR